MLELSGFRGPFQRACLRYDMSVWGLHVCPLMQRFRCELKISALRVIQLKVPARLLNQFYLVAIIKLVA